MGELTSRATVIPKPRYNPGNPSDANTRRSASNDEDCIPYEAVCVRDLITSTGTRIRHATTSPTDAATTWLRGDGLPKVLLSVS